MAWRASAFTGALGLALDGIVAHEKRKQKQKNAK
jgi:hypothetical protein